MTKILRLHPGCVLLIIVFFLQVQKAFNLLIFSILVYIQNKYTSQRPGDSLGFSSFIHFFESYKLLLHIIIFLGGIFFFCSSNNGCLCMYVYSGDQHWPIFFGPAWPEIKITFFLPIRSVTYFFFLQTYIYHWTHTDL